MGASAQNCSGVGWRRRRVRFNEILEKVPKVPEKVWDALLQSRVKFNFCRVRSGSTGFRKSFRVPEKLPKKVPGGFGTDPS